MEFTLDENIICRQCHSYMAPTQLKRRLTADGSYGYKGLVTDGVNMVQDYTFLYTCGPEAMLKAVYAVCKTSGQFSFEERMGCGFGACMGCTCKTKYGNKRICKDGPVLTKEEVVW